MSGHPPRVAVAGDGQASESIEQLAHDVGAELARRGAILYTGGLGGVMAAASRGAADAGGMVVGILPGADAAAANPYVTVPVATGMGHARNVVLVCSVDAVIAVGGRFGTLSEIALALKMGKKVISLCSWEVDPQVRSASTPAEAVSMALEPLGAR